MKFRFPLVWAVAVLLTLAVGCSTFTLADHSGPLAVPEHPRARDASAVVLPFVFAPEDPDDAGRLTEGDLARWQRMLAAGLDQANILESVAVASGAESRSAGDFAIGGRITRFRFQKSWIPTLIPIHLRPQRSHVYRLHALRGCDRRDGGGIQRGVRAHGRSLGRAHPLVRSGLCVRQQDQRLLGGSTEPVREPEPGLLGNRRFRRRADREGASLTGAGAASTLDSRRVSCESPV